MRLALPRLLFALLLGLAAAILPAAAQEDLRPLVDALGVGGFPQREAAIRDLAVTGDPAVASILDALAAGDLYARKSDGAVFIGKQTGQTYSLTDPLTEENAGEAPRAAVEKIRVNNSVRRAVRAAISGLTLMSPDSRRRRAAVENLIRTPDPDSIELLDTALSEEKDAGIAALMRQARAVAVLKSDRSEAEKLAAVETLKQRGGRDMIGILEGAVAAGGPVADAASAALTAIRGELLLWDGAQNVWYGLSLGSVLLLAAIGLAITFGVMGVINMAHGEMVMLGAYTTFVIQSLIRQHAPWLFDYSLFLALPAAFLVSGAVGVVIERGVIRWLYGRPLETLLATWGVSLILQQAVRTIFGPTNKEVGNPSWMSGSFSLGEMSFTYNRVWILVFALAVFVVLQLVLRRTSYGLQMRAVTQNRSMASAMGIRTPWVDALTFGLGSGIAGIAGVALSQIDNVSPDLGQGYIIDSFMVVVFGGVGNLWGTLVGALSLGVANKFLEPYLGSAVLAKIVVLVLIILFIQRRPRGLFALRGRAVEA